MKKDMEANRKKKRNSKKKRQRNKIIVFAVEVLLLVVVALGVYLWTQFSDIYSEMSIESEFADDSQAGINEDLSSETKETLKGYTNIALFGLDNRSVGNYDSGRSDSIIIASINNETKEVKLVSVYRDTYLSVGNGKFKKANTAYSSGGVKQAVQMLNTNLDLDIKEYVCVDWNALIEAIDALGGVNIDITEAEVKYINQYVKDMNVEIGSNKELVKSAGLQKLNGAQATAYARIRYTSGNDFKRTSRQRIVIEAMLEEAKSAKVSTLLDICKAVFGDISTTLTLSEILDLAMDISSYKIASTSGFPFEMTTKDLSGSGDTVVPILLDKNVAELHEYLFGTVDYEPSYSVKSISNTIIEKTAVDENTTPINVDAYNDTAGQDGTVFD